MLDLLAGAALMAQCQGKEGWSDPAPPARIHGQTYYVGTCGITAILIMTPKGHVLIDGGPAEAGPLVAANIRKVGARLRDVKLILASHEHHDHVGGLATLQKLSGAIVRAGPAATPVLASGKIARIDPQYGLLKPFAPVRTGRPLRDGRDVGIGSIGLTPHFTPGHAPGGTSWTWRSCEKGRCITLAYADSLSAVSADGYRFRDHPERSAALKSSFATVRKLDCDLLLTPHPSASGLFERMAGIEPLMDRNACSAYASRGAAGLEARLAKEAGAVR
jgi:metallo-beta-lactamase class B